MPSEWPIGDVTQLEAHAGILEHHQLSCGFKLGAERFLAEQGARSAQTHLQEGDVALVRHDGCPSSNERHETRRVIGVRVGVDHVANGLGGDGSFDEIDDGLSASFGLARFEHGDVVLELDRQAHVATGDEVDAGCQLLHGLDGRSRACAGRVAGGPLAGGGVSSSARLAGLTVASVTSTPNTPPPARCCSMVRGTITPFSSA